MIFEVINQTDFFVSSFIQGIQNTFFTVIFLFFNLFGSSLFWFFLSTVFYWKGNQKQSFYLALIILFSGVITATIKYVVARARPFEQGFNKINDFFEIKIAKKYDYSFPSGHATLASSTFFHFKKKIGSKMVFGLIIVLMVMLARIYLGMHFLSDVITGFAIGFLVAKTVEIPMKWIKKREMKLKKINPFFMGLVLFIIVLLLVEFSSAPELAMVFAGYFTGFLAFKESNIQTKKVGVKKLGIRIIPGTLIAVIPLALMKLKIVTGVNLMVLLFSSGLWITFFYPFIYTKLLKSI